MVATYTTRMKLGSPHQEPVYAAMVERFDAACGEVFAALQRTGADRNTLIVVTSDNGGVIWAWNEDGTKRTITSNAPLKGGKATNDDGGVRVPLIAVWPDRIPAGRIVDTPCIGTDLFPTVLAAANVIPPAIIPADGLNLLPVLTGTGMIPRTTLFWHYPHYHPYGATPHSAIRSGNLRLISTYEDGVDQLFDLVADPGEQHNLAPAQANTVKDFKNQLQVWRSTMGAQAPR